MICKSVIAARLGTAASVIVMALVSGAAAHAQTGAQTGAQAQSGGVTEIVVTAQKRSASADKTAISITAISGADLAARGITSFSDIAAGTPGVSIKSMGPGQTEFEMRGMASSGGNSPTVGFYLDDIPLTAPASAQNGKVVIDPTLYDLAQVEVLRGPQGTLYGSSSMGGTVKLITNKPKIGVWEESADVTASGTQGGGFNHAINGMINVPLGDTLAMRIVGSQSGTSGWINRDVVGNFPVATNGGVTRGDVLSAPLLTTHTQSNAQNVVGGRITLLWKPTSDLTVTPMAFYQHTHQDGPSAYDSDPGLVNGKGAHYQPFDIAEPYDDEIKMGSLNVNYRTASFDITSATSYWSRQSQMVQDNSENLPSCGGGFCVTTDSSSYYGATGTGAIPVLEIDPSHQFAQELRLTSNGAGPLKWLVGAYYANFGSNWKLYENVPNPAAWGSPTNQIFTVIQPTKITQEALFGEATYSPTEKLHITAGLRGYHYNTHVNTSSAGYGEPTGTATPVLLDVVQKATGVNPKVDISYNLDTNAMIYATAAKGFRPGGGNQPLPSSADPAAGFAYSMYQALQGLGYANGQAPTSYKPDSLWSYEVGEKVKLFDRHLRINSSAYYETWSNIQLGQLPLGYPLFDNVNSAHIYGGEVEVEAVAGGGLSAGVSGGYTHATLAATEHGFLAGARLPDVPKWSGSANIVYTAEISDTRSITLRLDDTYVGARVGLATYQGMVNDTQAPLHSYNLINFRGTLAAKSGWKLACFANNLTNKHAGQENLVQLGLPNASYNRVVTNQPRTIGLDFSIKM